MHKKKAPDYAVGYGKPPEHTRFQRGQSGNPKGRPKKDQTLAEAYHTALEAKVPITERGKRKVVTVREAIAKRKALQAMEGDNRALALISKELSAQQPESGNNLDQLLQEMRASHKRLEDDRNRDPQTDTPGDPEGGEHR